MESLMQAAVFVARSLTKISGFPMKLITMAMCVPSGEKAAPKLVPGVSVTPRSHPAWRSSRFTTGKPER